MKKFLGLICLFSFIPNIQANSLIKYASVKNIQKFLHLADSSIILKDKDSELKYLDVLNKNESEFEKSNSNVPFMDFTTSTYWMKLNLIHDTSVTERYYIELARPLTNIVNLYIFDENKQLLEVYKSGDDLPFSFRPIQNRKFIFPYQFKPNSKVTFIIQTKSDGEILKLPIKIWNAQAFSQFSSNENFAFGFYYGFISLVVILFTFFGVALREKIYFFFVSYVVLMGMFQFSLDGFSYKTLWPNNPYLGSHSILMLAALSMMALLSYANQFLEFYKESKIFMGIYKFFFGVVVVCFFTSLMSGSIYELTFPILNGVSFICTTLFFIGIYLRYKSGNKPGVEITLAFAFLWFGAIFFILSNVNIIKSDFLATNSLKIASGIEIMFLSISLAARYRTTQIEKIKAERSTNKILKEINSLKEEQTERLETQVLERTQEIENKTIILQEKNKEIINSITYAKRLQDALLPSKKIQEGCFRESSIFFAPKDIVSGDFYWIDTSKDYVFFAVADCTGHGVPGALVSVVGFNALNRCINEKKLTNTGEILDNLTDLVEHTFANTTNVVSDGMDICLCRWDYKDELTFSGAFNPLYIIRNNELSEIKGNKQPIGKFIKRTEFSTHTLKLEKGDSIILFSDGFADQFGGERGKKLKYSNFKDVLVTANKLPTDEFQSYLSTFLKDWMGSEEQIDDICIMKVQF